MGRPINKRFFGKATAGGNEIKVQFHNGTSPVPGWIIKQLATKKFRCTDGGNIEDCYLVDKNAGDLLANEMSITVKDDSGAVKQVVKIAARKVTVDTGESIKWNFSDSTSDDAVEMEEAGQNTLVINATSMVVGTEYEIVVAGTTDFVTDHSAADNNAGTRFTALIAGAGDGTVISVADAEADDFEGRD